ncbi:MAG: glycosyltransferase family 4 protein [Actinomycetota bacterium]|nr:glycosyltransferase family 4 protein [Actinomycetota bacterium]
MKIAHFVQGYKPAIGGTEYLMQRISEQLVNHYGDDVTVYTTNAYNCEVFNHRGVKTMEPGREVIDGVKVVRFKVFNQLAPALNLAQKVSYKWRWPRNDLIRTVYSGPILPGLLREMGKIEADVVCASSFPLMHMHYAATAARRLGVPLVLHGGLHPQDGWGFDRKIIYRSIEKADAYIANTNYERDFLLGKDIDGRKIHVVGVGTDPDKYAGATGIGIRDQYGLSDHPVVTFVGQQGGHKGIETLLKAMPLVWRQAPEARLMIAGSRTKYAEVLDAIIGGFEPEQRAKIIVINDFKEDEKPEIIAAGDIFASPSGFESFGITYLEAWAAGKPVIGCRSGAVPSVISDGLNGILVDYKDHRELAGALLELIFDVDLRRRMAEEGRKHVLKNYTWEIVAKKFRSIYYKAVLD